MTALLNTETSVNDPTILADIYQPENNIAIWPRTLPAGLSAEIDDLLKKTNHIALVQTVTPADVKQNLVEALPEHPVVAKLSQDIAQLVDMFCVLFDLKEAGLRLTRLDRAMCPRFHVDHLPCRLVTTYTGAATQWLQNEAVDRTFLGAGNRGLPDAESGIFKDAKAIQQLNAGDVALLKGSGWEGNDANGLVHRSPSLGDDEHRLLLTLDFM